MSLERALTQVSACSAHQQCEIRTHTHKPHTHACSITDVYIVGLLDSTSVVQWSRSPDFAPQTHTLPDVEIRRISTDLPTYFPSRRLVLPGTQAVVEFPITASRLGNQWLLVSLHCDQVTDIRGWAKISVVAPVEQSGSDKQPRPL